jgi:AcrR family transcriptional regulator
MTSSSTGARPLRRDVIRNRARILEAAGELFAERGLSVHLNDIAHHAGVGVGTVYRHFPNKEELIEILFQTRVDELVSIGQECLADPDPWHGLVSALERSLELQAADRGLHQLVQDSPQSLERLVKVRSRLFPISVQLIERAQASGSVRPDVSPADIPVVQLMIGSVADAGRDSEPELWRRYLRLVLRGIAAHPENMAELPGTPPTPEAIDILLSKAPQRSESVRRDPPLGAADKALDASFSPSASQRKDCG